MSEVIKHPLAEEVDDYEEYIRIKPNKLSSGTSDDERARHQKDAVHRVLGSPLVSSTNSVDAVGLGGSALTRTSSGTSAPNSYFSAAEHSSHSLPFSVDSNPPGVSSPGSGGGHRVVYDQGPYFVNEHNLDNLFPGSTRFPVTVAAVSKPLRLPKPVSETAAVRARSSIGMKVGRDAVLDPQKAGQLDGMSDVSFMAL